MPENAPSFASPAARQNPPKKRCFVVSPIGPDESETRKKADQVLKHIIKRSIHNEYEVVRADEINRSGTISIQIVQRLVDDDLVIADLSEQNPNVFYELAIRHAVRKPSVHIVTEGDEIPFDVQELRVIKYDLTNPDSIEEAGRRLQEQVKAIEAGESVLTPLQTAQILYSLNTDQTRGEKLQELLVGISAGISNLQSAVGAIVEHVQQERQAKLFASFGGPRVVSSGFSSLGSLAPSGFGGLKRAHLAPEKAKEVPTIESPDKKE